MKVINIKQYIPARILTLLCTVSLISCSSDKYDVVPESSDVGYTSLAVSIALSGPSRAEDDGKFEPGVGYENYIDISGYDYRLYFFGTDNKYIASFNPIIKSAGFSESSGYDSYYYNFLGKMPEEVGPQFKLVMLANWGKYPEEGDGEGFRLKPGVTTIQDLVTHASSSFSYLPSPGEDKDWLDDSRLIPFYGVRSYDVSQFPEYQDNVRDGKIVGNTLIDLRNEQYALPIIRAMAKVEVVLDNPFATFSSVELTKVNEKGYCAPFVDDGNWTFDYTDYFHGYDWDKDFVRIPHLVDGVNNPVSDNGGILKFKKVSDRTVDADGKVIPEKWVAYVPEYKNIGVEDNYTSIIIKLDDPEKPSVNGDETSSGSANWADPTKTIYFAENGSKVSNDNAKRFDIERNNIYRFTIRNISTSLDCHVDIQPYAEIKVDPFYGFERDKDGNIIISRNPDGTYEVLDNGHQLLKDQDGDVIKKRFTDGTLLCEETIYKDYIHDDSEIDYVYVFEKDEPGGNMIILRQISTGGNLHGDNVPDGEEHDHDTKDKPLFVLDKKGDFYYVHYDEDGNVTERTRTDSKGDLIIQANGYQFRQAEGMEHFIGTYIVQLSDGSEELRHWQTGEKVSWETGISLIKAKNKSRYFSLLKSMNADALKWYINKDKMN